MAPITFWEKRFCYPDPLALAIALAYGRHIEVLDNSHWLFPG